MSLTSVKENNTLYTHYGAHSKTISCYEVNISWQKLDILKKNSKGGVVYKQHRTFYKLRPYIFVLLYIYDVM